MIRVHSERDLPVDVDLDELCDEFGLHRGDECDSYEGALLDALEDLHEQAHGGVWRFCQEDSCVSLRDAGGNMPSRGVA